MRTRDHAGVYVPPPVVFTVPLLAAALVHARMPMFIGLSRPAAIAAAVVAIAGGVWLGLAGVASFRDAGTTILPAGRPTTAVVERGPYRFTRNPMYVAMSLAYIGVALLLDNLWALLLLPMVVLIIDGLVIRREERYLADKFGNTYAEYRTRVRRWL